MQVLHHFGLHGNHTLANGGSCAVLNVHQTVGALSLILAQAKSASRAHGQGPRAPLERARDCGKQLRAVADDRGRLAVDKMRDQVQHRGVQAQVLGRAAPASNTP